MKLEYKQVGSDIKNYHRKHIAGIPFEVALAWVKEVAPDVKCGNDKTFKDIVNPNDWENKMFVVVGLEHDKWVVLYSHDGKFSVATVDY